MTNQEIWQITLGEIELSVSRANFITWFKNTNIISNKDGKIIVGVPNGFAKEWLENKYNKLVLKALRNSIGYIKNVNYIISSSPEHQVKTRQKARPKKEKINLDLKEQLDIREFKKDEKTNLNSRYDFGSFVVASFNELAYAASQSVIKDLGKIYNPLFIYGGVGVGKTHLTQEIFFHIFNGLYEKNKQIILSSDRAPKAIPTLEERLRSRFEGGMMADIGRPDFETRLVILKKKAQDLNINISDETLSYIAINIQKNIRELEGALNRVFAFIKLNNIIPNQKQLTKILKTLISNPQKRTNYKKIAEVVASFYDINVSDLING